MTALPQIPGYRVVRLISEGKRSRMYLAEQESLSRQVALKVLSDEFYKDPQFKKRFIDGGKSGAQLNHPNILAVFDIGSVSGFPYIATEYLPGGTLRDRLDKGLDTATALKIGRDLAAALDFSHRHDINHRDLKPANVLFRSDGSAVLADPGILNATENSAKMSVGSPHYMSPEQVQAEPISARSDLYALGIMLYEMLSGKLPFDADDPFQVAVMQVNEPPPPLPDKLKAYQPLLDQLLAKDPAKRPESARAVVNLLTDLTETKTTPKPPVPAPAKPNPSAAARPVQPVRTPARPAPVDPLAQTTVAPAIDPAKMAATTMMPNPTMVVDQADMTAQKSPSISAAPPMRKYKPKPRWPALLAVLIAVAVIIVGLFWVFGGSDMPTGAGQVKPPENQLGGTKSLDENKGDNSVAQWIKRGQEQLEAGLLVGGDNNAALSFKRALRLDPTSQAAREGEEAVVKKVDETVRELMAQGTSASLNEAEIAVRRAREIYPDRVAFESLESSLEAKRKE